MSIITQNEFDQYAAAWLSFIGEAGPEEVQALFTNADKGTVQLHVDFDLPGTVLPLLSTVGIAGVMARFVLLSPEEQDGPRFGVVVYATDALGGRISAFYLGTSAWDDLGPQLTACEGVIGDPNTSNANGLVPFNLIKAWICNWAWAVKAKELSADMFSTNSYGPLQGYSFELSDFLDPLFTVKEPKASALRANFDLKLFYPSFPEGRKLPSSSFGLVMRLYPPAPGSDRLGGSGGGPSYDMGVPIPPG